VTTRERPRVFTFWEPRGQMTPYLQLCRETWDKSLTDCEIVVLDYSNLADYIGTGTLDRDRWGHLVDRFMDDLSHQQVAGHDLDVRENIEQGLERHAID